MAYSYFVTSQIPNLGRPSFLTCPSFLHPSSSRRGAPRRVILMRFVSNPLSFLFATHQTTSFLLPRVSQPRASPLLFRRRPPHTFQRASRTFLSMSSLTIGTHSGTFQADEALGVWMLRTMPEYKNSELVRSRDKKVLDPLDIVIDVGGEYVHGKKRYDHHQRGFDEVRFLCVVLCCVVCARLHSALLQSQSLTPLAFTDP